MLIKLPDDFDFLNCRYLIEIDNVPQPFSGKKIHVVNPRRSPYSLQTNKHSENRTIYPKSYNGYAPIKRPTLSRYKFTNYDEPHVEYHKKRIY